MEPIEKFYARAISDQPTVTHLFFGHEAIRRNAQQTTEQIAVTVVTKYEILRGRFDSLLKAADGPQLRQAIARLAKSERDLAAFPVIQADEAAIAAFDVLRQNKKLKKIGRPDMLIASIALANNVVLVTRNLRDFQLIPRLKVENWAD